MKHCKWTNIYIMGSAGEKKEKVDSKAFLISNNVQWKWIKISNQKTHCQNGSKNKIHLYVIYKTLTLDLRICMGWK